MIEVLALPAVAGLVGLSMGFLTGNSLTALRWRLNAKSPDTISAKGKTFKVIELGDEWSLDRFRDLDPDVELPEMAEHRYCFIHRGDMAHYDHKNCEMCQIRHELEQSRTRVAQQQEILDDLAAAGFVRSVFVPHEIKDKIFALNKDDAAEEFIRRIKAETLEKFADDFGCTTSYNALQEAQRIRDGGK